MPHKFATLLTSQDYRPAAVAAWTGELPPCA
jgi:hypothetical protein